jgi:hypothetical protein
MRIRYGSQCLHKIRCVYESFSNLEIDLCRGLSFNIKLCFCLYRIMMMHYGLHEIISLGYFPF